MDVLQWKYITWNITFYICVNKTERWLCLHNPISFNSPKTLVLVQDFYLFKILIIIKEENALYFKFESFVKYCQLATHQTFHGFFMEIII